MRVIVIAGPNGAGKTSFAKHYLQLGVGSPPFVNGDEIAALLSPSDPGAVALQAGRIAFHRIRLSSGLPSALPRVVTSP